jgi:hypothetical protein
MQRNDCFNEYLAAEVVERTVEGKDGSEMWFAHGRSIIDANTRKIIAEAPQRSSAQLGTHGYSEALRVDAKNAVLLASSPMLLKALQTIASQSLGDDWTAEQAIAFVKQLAREAIGIKCPCVPGARSW